MRLTDALKPLRLALFVAYLSFIAIFAACKDEIAEIVATDNLEQINYSNLTYPIVDTKQGFSYDNTSQMTSPVEGEAFYGQDAQYTGNAPSYSDNGDGTITDNVTGLTWTQEISRSPVSWEQASGYCDTLSTGGYSDWRLPTVKELWSIRDFSMGWPWIDTDYFYLVGDGSELGQHHSWTATRYLVESEYQNEQVMGEPSFIVNDWTGHIKAMSGMRFVRAVRGTETYGFNDFVDNSDGTITDKATGLMWSQDDSGEGFLWEEALDYAENATVAGYNDWRLPNAKELQSIADYSGALPAMNTTYFHLTELTNVKGQTDYPFYWSSTSNPIEGDGTAVDGGTVYAWVLAAGYNTDPDGNDLHGAGSVVFCPKSEAYFSDLDPEIHRYNYVRLVRGGNVTETPDGDPGVINEDRVVVFPDADMGNGGGGSDTGGSDFAPGVEYLATIGISVTAEDLKTIIGGPPAPTKSELAANFAAANITLTEAQAQELLNILDLK